MHRLPKRRARKVTRQRRGSNQQEQRERVKQVEQEATKEVAQKHKMKMILLLKEVMETNRMERVLNSSTHWTRQREHGSQPLASKISTELVTMVSTVLIGGKYVEPPSFEYLFLLADFLYPVEEGEQTFHRRLFESESRPGTKVRQQLRKIKDETPDNPIVCWHRKGKQWIPPSVHAFKGIVRLIVSM